MLLLSALVVLNLCAPKIIYIKLKDMVRSAVLVWEVVLNLKVQFVNGADQHLVLPHIGITWTEKENFIDRFSPET